MKNVQPLARLGGVCLLGLFLLLIWFSARAGCASLLYTYAASSSELAAANAAVSLSPSDPEAHYLRGAILEASGEFTAATAEYNQAIIRRPNDYALWLTLARVQELNGQALMAIAAARRATELAPYYAQPHWQLGNLLVRAGRAEEGFRELNLAGASNPELLMPSIDLAWQLSQGKIQFVMQSIQPNTPVAYLAMAEYLKKHGQVADVTAVLRSAGSLAEDYRRQYVDELLKANQFTDAYAVWSIGQPSANESRTGTPNISDPSFEHERRLDEPGFDWRMDNKAQTIKLSLDPENPQDGKKSLRVEFNGDSDPRTQIISQLVLVEPNSRYQLHFAVRTETLVSGGLPQLVVMDAGDREVLGQTNPFSQTQRDWQDDSLDFKSKERTSAILISLQRARCAETLCPIFGRLWLDNFSSKKL